MDKIIVKILIVCMFLSSLICQVYAVEQENTSTNTTKVEEKTNEKPTEVKKNETMYVQERCNIRSSYSAESDRVGGLDAGAEVTVVSEYSNGWYKIKYDGGEAYVKSGILGNTKPESQEETEQTEPEAETLPEQTQQAEENEPTVPEINNENNDEVPIEDAELINEIGVLPEVGKNMADYLYGGVIIIAIVFIIELAKRRGDY